MLSQAQDRFDEARAVRAGSLPDVPLYATVAIVAMAMGVISVFSIELFWTRALIAALLVLVLLAVALVNPQLSALLTLGFLICVAVIRRMLIPWEGFKPFDPLLVVGPVTVTVMFLWHTVWKRHRLVDGMTSGMVLALLVIGVLEVGNPYGGGLAIGAVGLLYVGVPLLWYFVGRDLFDRDWLRRVGWLVLVLGVLNAAYGLYQTLVDFPPWDHLWIQYIGGNYTALSVGGTIRAVGTFSSASEYGIFLAAAVCVALAAAARRRRLAYLLPLPLLLWALFLESGRTPVILCAVAALLIVSAGGQRPGRAFMSFLVVVALVGGVDLFAARNLAGGDVYGGTGTQRLVSHQIEGLTHPLDRSRSTLIDHLNLMWGGVQVALRAPAGLGTGSTNLATERLGGTGAKSATTEIDITNVFVAYGMAGGLLFVGLILRIFWTVGREAFRRPELEWTMVLAVLVSTFTQWLNGGLYAIAPLVWLLIGASVGALDAERRRQEHDELAYLAVAESRGRRSWRFGQPVGAQHGLDVAGEPEVRGAPAG